MKQTIPEIIRRKRMEKGLSQRELAQRLNVSFQAVSKWERGVNLPDILLIPTLCAVLGITADELLDISPHP
jgi:tellurite methyltransferase